MSKTKYKEQKFIKAYIPLLSHRTSTEVVNEDVEVRLSFLVKLRCDT